MVRVFRWHSINLVPHFTLYSVCSDGTQSIVARAMDLILFGLVIQITVPSKRGKRFYSSPWMGPLYSRKRKCWYRFGGITKEHWNG